MDILSYILAKKYTNKIAASSITSVTTEEDSEGNTWLVVVYNTSPTPTTIRYKIPTIAGRGISSVEITEDYKLKITYSDGTTWTSPQSIRGPKGDKGDKGDPGTASVSVSASGTATDEVKYITIDGTEKKLGGNLSLLTASSDPTSATIGQVGQFYYNTSNYGLFICVSTSPYVWNKVFTNQTTLGTGVVSINTKNNNNNNFVAIGYQASAGNASVTIGCSSESYGSKGVAIGYSAKTNGNYAMQIGEGQNTTAETMQVWSYRLLEKSTGLIPFERMNNIKTTMDSVAVLNAQYFLGEQASLLITLPSNANVGNEILVVFSSGATPCALTCNLQGFSFVPKANKTSWIKFTYCASDNWLVEVKEG